MEIDLANISLQGVSSYESIFKKIAEIPVSEPIFVLNAPWSWVPLLRYLKCEVLSTCQAFAHCWCVRQALCHDKNPHIGRTLIEVLSAFRPETVECLRKVDCQWKTGRPIDFPLDMDFIVTNSSSFHRKEVLNFAKLLDEYTPPTKKVLLVPASAEKPYPSPLHKACLEILPDSFYLACVSGVLGIAPQELWHRMPCYSAGVSNEWHVRRIIGDFIDKHRHKRVVFYSDVYNDILESLFCSETFPYTNFDFVLPSYSYDLDERNLLDPQCLEKLKAVLEQCQ